MPIKSRIEPVGGRDIVNTALSQSSYRSQYLPALRGSPQTGTPLSVYLLSRDEALLPDPFSAARLIGWKYPIIGGDSPGLAFLLIAPDGLKFAGISHGPLPNRLLDAAVLANNHLESLVEEFEPRLLEIPALRIYALWLFRAEGENIFISLMDGQPPGSFRLQIENNIKARISQKLKGISSHYYAPFRARAKQRFHRSK
jgi:hypothetical protein